MTLDLAVLHRTRNKINVGIWICAALTMMASAASGAYTFNHLKEAWGLGLGTAVAIDVALWVVLTGERQLQLLGLKSGRWGTTMRYGTAAMSIILNCTAAWLDGSPMLVILHAFVPLLLVGLSEFSNECAQKFVTAERLAVEESRALLENTSIVAPSERVAAEPPAATTAQQAPTWPAVGTTSRQAVISSLPRPEALPPAPAFYRSDAAPARPHSDQQKLSFPTSRQRSNLRVSTPTSQAAARRSDVRTVAFAWLDQHHNSQTTAAKLAAGINGSPHTCKKLLGEWRKNRQEVAS
jgi:hypothetical protein